VMRSPATAKVSGVCCGASVAAFAEVTIETAARRQTRAINFILLSMHGGFVFADS